MNRGPMSRLEKVPVKCKTCGKIKYNVVCREEIQEEQQAIEKPTTKKEPEVKKEIVYKKPRPMPYIQSVVSKQDKMASNAYKSEE